MTTFGFSIRKVAYLLDISPGFVQYILNGKRKPGTLLRKLYARLNWIY